MSYSKRLNIHHFRSREADCRSMAWVSSRFRFSTKVRPVSPPHTSSCALSQVAFIVSNKIARGIQTKRSLSLRIHRSVAPAHYASVSHSSPVKVLSQMDISACVEEKHDSRPHLLTRTQTSPLHQLHKPTSNTQLQPSQYPSNPCPLLS